MLFQKNEKKGRKKKRGRAKNRRRMQNREVKVTLCKKRALFTKVMIQIRKGRKNKQKKEEKETKVN